MIRIKRNTHNFFSLLRFIAFLINTFTFSNLADAFIQSDLQGNVKLHLVRGIKLAILNRLLYPLYQSHTCYTCYIVYTYIDITPYTASCLALAALAVLDFAMIMVLYSS